LRNLLESYYANNPENLQLTLSLPADDLPTFRAEFGTDLPNVSVISDESYCDHDLSDLGGWYGQQVCKLMSWKVVNAAHYIVLDSDCYFSRPVTAEEFRPLGRRFVAYGSLVRTVLKEGNENLRRYMTGKLVPEPNLFPEAVDLPNCPLSEFVHLKDLDPNNPGPLARSDVPHKVFGSKKWIFFQPGQILSRDLVAALCRFFREHRLSVEDAIRISPWEYNWYGEFAVSRYFDQTQFRVSAFLHFQTEEDIEFARNNGITEAQIADKFPIVAMAARHFPRLRFDHAALPIVTTRDTAR
jgi:Family of unknown function (DUF6492)